MSNMKLYRGINNIDDDLIEEAGRENKPVIRRYYSFAASAAALLIAAGVPGFGFLRGEFNRKDPSPSESIVISETTTTSPSVQPTTETFTVQTSKAGTSAPAGTDPAANAEMGTAPAVSSVQNTKTYNINTAAAAGYSPAQTTADTAVTVCFTTAPEAAVTDTGSPVYDKYEYEGRIVMKKFFAMSTALLMLSNGPVLNAKAETYAPANSVLDEAQAAKAFIEDNNVDLDLNSDGKTDIIDMYAFYVADSYYHTDDEVKKLPDDVWEKYKAIPVIEGTETIKTDPDTGEEYTYYDGYYRLYSSDLAYYFLTYNTMDLSYLDPDFYTENCPEDYDTSDWIISSFIRNYIQYGLFKSGRSYDLVKDMIEREELDMDINSDGTFNFDDILLLLCFRANVGFDFYAKSPDEEPDEFYHNYEKYCEVYEMLYSDPDTDWGIYHQPYKITESEFSKACAYFENASKYLADYCDEDVQLDYLIKYYLTNNKIEKKYFDPGYYSDDESFRYHCHDYEYRSINKTYFRYNSYSEPFFGKYTYYMDFASKFGPGVIDDYTPTEEDVKRYSCTQEDIEAIFPTYYKNVKTGVLPEPDMDKNGVITAADYCILYNLNCENISPFDESESAKLIRNYPELQIKVKATSEIRENYNTNFDFNENGISCDRIETECMMMYILNELDSVYSTEEEFTEACQYYMHSHPGINYDALLQQEIRRFSAERESYDFDYKLEASDAENIGDSVNTATKYMSGIDLSVLRTGDANCDSTTTLADALLILQNSVNNQKYPITKEGEFNADVFETGDGLTPMDAFVIQQWDTQKNI